MSVHGEMPVRPGAERGERAFLGGCHVFLPGGSDKKARKAEKQGRAPAADSRVREAFLAGRFPVVTTHQVEGRKIAKVLGLVCCRGFDSDVAFHPDGSKYFTCYGTAVLFEYDPTDPESLPLMLQQRFRERDQRINDDMI